MPTLTQVSKDSKRSYFNFILIFFFLVTGFLKQCHFFDFMLISEPPGGQGGYLNIVHFVQCHTFNVKFSKFYIFVVSFEKSSKAPKVLTVVSKKVKFSGCKLICLSEEGQSSVVVSFINKCV